MSVAASALGALEAQDVVAVWDSAGVTLGESSVTPSSAMLTPTPQGRGTEATRSLVGPASLSSSSGPRRRGSAAPTHTRTHPTGG